MKRQIMNSMEIPLKTRNKSTVWPATPLLGIYHEKIIMKKRHKYPNVHYSTIYSNQGMEAT